MAAAALVRNARRGFRAKNQNDLMRPSQLDTSSGVLGVPSSELGVRGFLLGYPSSKLGVWGFLLDCPSSVLGA